MSFPAGSRFFFQEQQRQLRAMREAERRLAEALATKEPAPEEPWYILATNAHTMLERAILFLQTDLRAKGM